jgi:hypothetical protein
MQNYATYYPGTKHRQLKVTHYVLKTTFNSADNSIKIIGHTFMGGDNLNRA